MVSTNNSWHLLREQLMQIEDTMIPSAPVQKDEKFNDNHWIEFDMDVLIGEKVNNKIGCLFTISECNYAIIITKILNNDGSLHLFDMILSLNDIHLTKMTKETAQCLINAHQGKHIKIRIRRLQPTILETIEINLHNQSFINSRKLGCTLHGGIGRNDSPDPGLFIIGIKPNSRAAINGRLRIGDRLMQISNTYTTINLQCMEFDMALKLIERMRNESTSITLVVAHPTQN
jgi:hypothetical protein